MLLGKRIFLAILIVLFLSFPVHAIELDTDDDDYVDLSYMPLDELWTFQLGVTISSGQAFKLGTIRWDNGSNLIDGDRIADDTIDDDSIDFDDVTLADFGLAATHDTAEELDAFLALKVSTTGNETVAGIKTFSSFPIGPSSAPTTNYQVSNKKYVDDAIIAVGGGDVYSVGDCTSGACLDGTVDGGTEALFYDANGATTLVGGDTAAAITVTLPDSTGTLTTATEQAASYQPLEATLTDIADGTIAENLVNTTNPWAVNEGGTGAATYALNGVLFGNGTSAIGVTAIGAAGTILQAGADPFVPAWSAYTLPSTVPTVGKVLISDGTNMIGSTALGTGAYATALAATHDEASELDALYEAEITNSAGLLSALSDETGTGFAVFSISPTVTGTMVAANIDGSGTFSANLFTPDGADGADIGTDALEFSDVYLADGSIIKGQNDQSATLTSSASTWTASNFASSGTLGVAGVLTSSNTTEASAIGTAAVVTGGGLGVAFDAWIGDDLVLDSDESVIKFGADQDVTLTHTADAGLNLKQVTDADDNPFILILQTGETDMAASDVLGGIYFQAPDEGTGTDAILVAAGIEAVSEGDFAADSNATKLSFKTGASEVAAEKMYLSSAGALTVTGAITDSGGAVENETHASEHTIGGADITDRLFEGATAALATLADTNTDFTVVSKGLYYTHGLATVTIDDFSDADQDHSEFSDGDYFGILMDDGTVTIDFSANANIEGNAGKDFTDDASDEVFLLFTYYDGTWYCINYNSGFSTPTTLAIDKAQFDYSIANPQAIIIGTDLTAGSDDITIGTEITSSTVYLTSDSDDDTDTLVLQVAGAGYDGAKLTFVTKAGFDAPGDAVIIDMADAICNDGDCPYSASFTLRGIGATLTLTWDSTTASWWLENFYQPPVDFYTDADHKTTIVGIDEFGSSTFVEYSIKNDMVTVLFRIVGEEAGTTPVTITAPYTSKERSDAGMLVVFPVFAVNGTTTPGGGWGVCGLSNNSVAITCYPPLDHGVDYSGSWGTDGNEVRAIQGEFYYVAE